MTSEAPRRRLHPAAIAVDAVRSSLQLFGGIVLVMVVRGSGPGTTAAFALAGIVGGALIGFLGWRRTTYWIDGPALHLRSGVFTPDEKIVPSARVQGVDTTTGPLQRAFGVVEVRVQVPGAADADEIVLSAVTHAEAARLRAALGQPAPAEPDELLRLGLRDLLLAAATGPQISVALSAVAGVYALLNNVVDFEKDGEGLIGQVDTVQDVALFVAALLFAGYVLAFLAAIVVFSGFEVRRDGGVLRIRRGLFERRGTSLPLERVDGIVIVEGLARGPLGLAALRIESAAHGGERAAGRTLLPLVRRRDAEATIARLVPSLTVAAGELEHPPRRALRRFVLVPSLAGFVTGGAFAVVLGVAVAWVAAPALALLGALVGLRGYRAAGVRMAGSVVVVREARLARRTLLARRHRLQEHALRRTPLQARASLADLRVTVGSGGQGRARHLERATAEAAFGALRRPA